MEIFEMDAQSPWQANLLLMNTVHDIRIYCL